MLISPVIRFYIPGYHMVSDKPTAMDCRVNFFLLFFVWVYPYPQRFICHFFNPIFHYISTHRKISFNSIFYLPYILRFFCNCCQHIIFVWLENPAFVFLHKGKQENEGRTSLSGLLDAGLDALKFFCYPCRVKNKGGFSVLCLLVVAIATMIVAIAIMACSLWGDSCSCFNI